MAGKKDFEKSKNVDWVRKLSHWRQEYYELTDIDYGEGPSRWGSRKGFWPSNAPWEANSDTDGLSTGKEGSWSEEGESFRSEDGESFGSQEGESEDEIESEGSPCPVILMDKSPKII